VAVVLGTGLLAGCAASTTAGPRSAAEAFTAAWEQKDGGEVCRLLAPGTRTEVAESAKQPCATAVLDEELPAAGAVRVSEVWGREAQVRMRGDTYFLAEFPAGWRVVAAGCRPQSGKPYDCQVKGG
jgi:hypothetical protein